MRVAADGSDRRTSVQLPSYNVAHTWACALAHPACPAYRSGSLLGSDTARQLVQQKCKSLIIGCSANYKERGVHQGFLDAGAATCWPKPLPAVPEIRAQLREFLPWRLPGQARVLIVDDSHVNRKMLTRQLTFVCPVSWEFAEHVSASAMLAAMGFAPPPPDPRETKGGGEQNWTLSGRLLEAADPFECGYDLIVLDEHMPYSVNGTVAMRLLRRAGCGAVIAGFSGNQIAKQHLAAGADLSWCKLLPRKAELAADLVAAFKSRGLFSSPDPSFATRSDVAPLNTRDSTGKSSKRIGGTTRRRGV